jgi:hypothetical protein
MNPNMYIVKRMRILNMLEYTWAQKVSDSNLGFWGSRAALKESLRNLLLHGSWIRHGAAKIRRRSKQEKKTIKKKSADKPEEEHNRQRESKQSWNLNNPVLLED